MPNRPAAALIGKVGDGRATISSSATTRARSACGSSGRLYLGVNDDVLQRQSRQLPGRRCTTDRDMRHYSAHAGPLRAELGHGAVARRHDAVHQKSRRRHLLIAARQFALLGLATWGLIRFDHPPVWIPLALVQGFTIFNFTVLLHEVVHLAVFERRRPRAERLLALALCGAERHLGLAVHALASRSSRGARIEHRRSETASPVAEDQRALVQAAVLLAGAVPDLLPRRAPRVVPRIRRICSAGSPVNGGSRSLAHLGGAGCDLVGRRRRGGAARLRDPGVLHLPDRVHAEPSRPALRHRSDGSGAVDDADARPLVLGLLVPELELPPRASLFPGRAVLPPACACSARSCRSTSSTSIPWRMRHWSRLARRQPRRTQLGSGDNTDRPHALKLGRLVRCVALRVTRLPSRTCRSAAPAGEDASCRDRFVS